MKQEIWKTTLVDEYTEISTLGKVRRNIRPILYKDGRKGFLAAGVMRCTRQKTGYISVCIKGKQYLLHRLLAETFLDAPKDIFVTQTVNHKNGIKDDNRLENIEWATYQQNNAHARNTGLNKQHGEKHNLAKYTDQFIDSIRNVYLEYNPNYEKLGQLFGITETHAKQIVLHLTRKKLTS